MTHPLRYIVVDDDELDRLAVHAEASRYPFLQLAGLCTNPVEAFELASAHPPDILFADVEMPDVSGIELLERLAGKIAIPVLITSHPEYAVDGYRLQAFDYLLKPLTSARFDACIDRISTFREMRDRAFAFEAMNDTDSIIIKQGYDKHKILTGDILYLEAMKDYTRIVTGREQFLVLELLGNLLTRLPQERFSRIHRSFVVNRSKVAATRQLQIVLKNGHTLPVGKSYRQVLTGLPEPAAR